MFLVVQFAWKSIGVQKSSIQMRIINEAWFLSGIRLCGISFFSFCFVIDELILFAFDILLNWKLFVSNHVPANICLLDCWKRMPTNFRFDFSLDTKINSIQLHGSNLLRVKVTCNKNKSNVSNCLTFFFCFIAHHFISVHETSIYFYKEYYSVLCISSGCAKSKININNNYNNNNNLALGNFLFACRYYPHLRCSLISITTSKFTKDSICLHKNQMGKCTYHVEFICPSRFDWRVNKRVQLKSKHISIFGTHFPCMEYLENQVKVSIIYYGIVLGNFHFQESKMNFLDDL